MINLSPEQAPADPIELFAAWYEQAADSDTIMYARAACLSTIDADGWPDGRIVLLHAFDESGFAFFTDARSAKGRALVEHPVAALTFYWGPMERQVRLQGRVETAPDEVADLFFADRPRRSQVTAWASVQSQPVRASTLDAAMARWELEFEHAETIPRPPYWQAYRLAPRRIEFWQARAQRLHDRLLYTTGDDGGWTRLRLAP